MMTTMMVDRAVHSIESKGDRVLYLALQAFNLAKLNGWKERRRSDCDEEKSTAAIVYFSSSSFFFFFSQSPIQRSLAAAAAASTTTTTSLPTCHNTRQMGFRPHYALREQ